MTNEQPNEQPNARDLAMQFLFQQLTRISPPGDDTAGMLTLRTSTGKFIGDVWLSDSDVEALGITVESLANCKQATEESTRPDALLVMVDPFLEGELEEYCIGLDVDALMAKDPAEAVAEFDLITSDKDGEQ